MIDAQLAALIEQAGRNLDSLELLVGMSSGAETETIAAYQARLRDLKRAYHRETNELTLKVLYEAVERRGVPDRRHAPDRRVNR
jgi:hypothetical protein